MLSVSKSLSVIPGAGGDRPERQFRALLAILNMEDSDGFELMTPGSEIVLLTDADSHEIELESNVTIEANKRNVCISLYCPYDFVPYKRIVDSTGGTLENSIDDESFGRFYANHECGKCARFYGLPPNCERKKRQAVPPTSATSTSNYDTEQRCHYFNTSLFTTELMVQGFTIQDEMLVTTPNGKVIHVVANYRGEKVYLETVPVCGQWSACVKIGTLTITVHVKESISTILQYFKPPRDFDEPIFTSTPPPACKKSPVILQ